MRSIRRRMEERGVTFERPGRSHGEGRRSRRAFFAGPLRFKSSFVNSYLPFLVAIIWYGCEGSFHMHLHVEENFSSH